MLVDDAGVDDVEHESPFAEMRGDGDVQIAGRHRLRGEIDALAAGRVCEAIAGRTAGLRLVVLMLTCVGCSSLRDGGRYLTRHTPPRDLTPGPLHWRVFDLPGAGRGLTEENCAAVRQRVRTITHLS